MSEKRTVKEDPSPSSREQKVVEEDIVGAAAIKPPGWDREGWEYLKFFLYDPEHGTILGRTPLSWLLVTIFYLVFFSSLLLFWFSLLGVFFLTLPPHSEGPRYTVEDSQIGANPGISSLPSYDEGSLLFTLEMYDTNLDPTDQDGKGTLNADYATRLKNFLALYNNPDININLGYTKFDLEKELGDCAHFPYGYVSEEDGIAIKPCIFLKMNNIWSWNPEPIDAEDFENNPDWPESLEDNFRNLTYAERKQVFVDCQGESSVDQESINEGLTFIPKTKGFPIKSFPYKGNKEKYQPSLVALQFDGNKLTKFMEEMITVKCKAYYKGGPSQGEFRIRFQTKNFR